MKEIYEIRRRRLLEFLERFKTNKQAADALGLDASHLGQLKMGGDRKNGRNIGEELARGMEQAAGLPALWFDDTRRMVAVDERHEKLIRRFDRLSREDQDNLLGWLAVSRMLHPYPNPASTGAFPQVNDPDVVEEYLAGDGNDEKN